MHFLIPLALFVSSAVAGTVNRRQLGGSRCDQVCSQQYAPVCGSDGKTYSNMCMLTVMACRYQEKGMSLTVARHGACGTNHFHHVDDAACNLICDEERKPLCASNGQVYDNTCQYKRAECEAARNQTRLSIVVYGDTCPTPKTPDCAKYHLDTTDIAVEGGVSIQPSCPSTHAYLCASNSRSYGNECQLCHFMETKNATLTIIYEGMCHNSAESLGSGTTDSLAALLSHLFHHQGGKDPVVG